MFCLETSLACTPLLRTLLCRNAPFESPPNRHLVTCKGLRTPKKVLSWTSCEGKSRLLKLLRQRCRTPTSHELSNLPKSNNRSDHSATERNRETRRKKSETHLENATRFEKEQTMTGTLLAPHDLAPTHTAPDTYQARRRGIPTGYKRFAAWTSLSTPVP